ncbi:peptidylprolyl isomerase [Stakelama saccharophila]|uniref:peptidylprolyl isomerase n=2 Tax=Stakelama saccharophila TaxID=3075605 RepID=A0ABZ0BCX3_9SPHN|nr:peptidylprolyl isomerase [Stakelama sp. W311]WNO55095.1 peptidylprolyl isomerase [Stakelama sp. W311]
MRTIFYALLTGLAALLALGTAAAGAPDTIRVRIVTTAGPITVALDRKHAPKTVENFMDYVDDGRLDGTQFYRTSRRKGDPKHGFIQGGIGMDARRVLPSVPLEPTSETGIKHSDATISMAHGADPDSATGNFSIMVGDNPSLDAHGDYRGFAAFGHVVAGMNVVKKILAMKSGGGRGSMKGQMILDPVRIVRVQRLNGTPHPTGRPKPWLINIRR